jgi:hypothetical protein
MPQPPDDAAARPIPTDSAGGALVPIDDSVVKGIQAWRRGDAILYTVRGEPKEVGELILELEGQGIDEIIAMISHEAQPEDEEPASADTAEEPDAATPPNEGKP